VRAYTAHTFRQVVGECRSARRASFKSRLNAAELNTD
jgi:hypothetical protein